MPQEHREQRSHTHSTWQGQTCRNTRVTRAVEHQPFVCRAGGHDLDTTAVPGPLATLTPPHGSHLERSGHWEGEFQPRAMRLGAAADTVPAP